jgi:hypothetical protein
VDSSKLGVGEIVAGISALALFLFMFLPWYGIDSVGGFGVSGGDANAWEAFSFIDILLFLVAVLVVGLVIAALAEATPDLPAPPAQVIAIAGVVALLLILFRLVVTPDVDTAGVDVDIDLGRKIGIFLGLVAAGGIAYGGWRAMSETAPAPPTPTPDPTPAEQPTPPVDPTPPPAPEPPAQQPPRQEPPAGGYSPPQQ